LIVGAGLAVPVWQSVRDTKMIANRDPPDVATWPRAQSVNAVRAAIDDVDQQIQEARRGAELIATHLRPSIANSDHDPLSSMASALAHQAESLERELASGRGVAATNPVRSHFSPQP
jgi:hypothetical protein